MLDAKLAKLREQHKALEVIQREKQEASVGPASGEPTLSLCTPSRVRFLLSLSRVRFLPSSLALLSRSPRSLSLSRSPLSLSLSRSRSLDPSLLSLSFLLLSLSLSLLPHLRNARAIFLICPRCLCV